MTHIIAMGTEKEILTQGQKMCACVCAYMHLFLLLNRFHLLDSISSQF